MTEEQVYEILKPHLTEVLEMNSVGSDSIVAERGKQFTSVSYLRPEQMDTKGALVKARATQLAFRILARKEKFFFGVRDGCLQYAPESLRAAAINCDGGYVNVPFFPTEDGILEALPMLRMALDGSIDSGSCEYGCCSRVEQCSDAKKCLQPHPYIAANCNYRKILKSGRIFYGKNRNVD